MSQSLRVTIVTRSLMMGGAQRHIVKLCRALASENVAISVCLLINDEPGDLVDELPPQTRLHVFPYKRHDIRTVFWLASIVRAEKSQVVHSFLWHADFYASLLKLLVPGLVVLASERGDRGDKKFYRTAYRLIDRLLVFRLVDGFCANSNFGKRLLQRLGCKRKDIWVIPNGIDIAAIDSQHAGNLRKKYDWPETSILCCVVSRLEYYKGIDSFIRLIKFCRQDIKFLIVGDGPEKENLSCLIDELSLGNRVFLVGQHKPAISFIKNSDICMLPTTVETEHCSNSILEYMACVKPVVAMDVAGNPELVITGETGILIDLQEVTTLPSVLDALACNKELAKQMGLAGRNRIEERFQMDEVAKKFNMLWKEFLIKQK